MPAFSDKFIRETETPSAGRKLLFDNHRDAPAGFGMRVSPKGKRTFVLRYNAEGKDRLMTVGEYSTWTLAAARKQAHTYRREIDSGADILEERRESRAEPTVADVAERWFDEIVSKQKRGYDVRGAVERHLLSAIGGRRIATIRRAEVRDVVKNLAAKYPRQSALVLTYAKQLFAYAQDCEIIENSPVATLKPSKIDKRMAPKSRDRVLRDDEIVTFWNMQQPPSGMHEATLRALKFILLTGQRPGEVCQAKHSEVRGKTWTIPAAHRGKTNDTHIVPLTDSARALIGDGAEYLFERSQGQAMDVNALSKAVRLCHEAFGMDAGDRWRPHDLRRTMRTGLAACKISETVAELAVGHVRKGIAAVYDQHRYESEKRQALEAWERRLLLIADGKDVDQSNVVPMVATS